MIEKLFEELSAFDQVEVIALGGSRAGEVYDEKSDYDVYLYCNGPIEEQRRQHILEKYCSYMEIGNSFWELEDNCVLNNGIDIDILYRNLDDFVNDVASVVEQHNARNGSIGWMGAGLPDGSYETCEISGIRLSLVLKWDHEVYLIVILPGDENGTYDAWLRRMGSTEMVYMLTKKARDPEDAVTAALGEFPNFVGYV